MADCFIVEWSIAYIELTLITRVEGKDIVSPRFFAIGLYGQVLFCDPTQNLIFVTLGEKKGSEYHLLFDDFCNLISQ